MIYLVNLSEKDFIRKKNKWLPKIKEYVDKNDPGATIIPFSGAFELKLMELETEEEKKAYLEETKCATSLDKIIVQGYKALQLIYFFTAGADEVKAWTIQKGFKAPQAAGRIHTDFEKGFIMAEVNIYFYLEIFLTKIFLTEIFLMEIILLRIVLTEIFLSGDEV